MECSWQHELPECSCIAVDAEVPVAGTFSRVSLFRVEVENSKVKKGKSIEKNSLINGTLSSEFLGDRNYTYLIDYNRTGDIEPVVYPLVLDEPGVSLTCVKIVGGDTIIVGGTRGYIGVCEYGGCDIVSRQFEGHSVDNSVVCMASCSKRNFAVCGDDGGGLSLWMCTGTDERVHCITVLGGEISGRSAINCIQFIPDRDLVAISTRSQYLLLGLRVSADTGRYELEGIVEMNVNSLFSALGSDVSPVKSMPSFGGDGNTELFHCHCLAFPSHSESITSAANFQRQDFGDLKTHTLTPPRSGSESTSTEKDKCSWPLVVWKVSGVSQQTGIKTTVPHLINSYFALTTPFS